MVFAIDFTVLIIVLSRVFLLDLKKHKLLLRLGFTIATTVCCSLLANVDKLTDENHITYDGFALSASNKNFGTLATFFYGTKGMFIKKPNGYSDNNIKELLESCGTQAGTDLNPNVVVIMNEAFCDYGSLLDVQPDTDPLPYWHSLTDNAIDGDLMVPVTGGGTSYTEFEFLSGIGGGIFNNTYNPFLMGIHDDTYSIACDFKRLGYKSIGIHPFWGICWNRNLVYPRLGFDTFISGEDFDNKSASDSTSGYIIDSTDLGDIDYVRNYASDKESYNKVIEQFENKASDEKLFVFNVTVQNHSGYEYFGDDFEYKVNSIKYNQYQPLNQYLSLLKYSDEAYEELIEYFKDYPEPTVVLMFGDHQPGFKYYEPEEGKNKYDTYYQYVTNYKLWANYPLPDDLEGGTTSAGLLSLKLKQAAGLPLNEWDCFRRRLSERFTGISLYGYAKPKNNMFEYNGELNSDDKKLLDKYKCLEYYLFFKQGLPE
jgi:phosphoglycerol transferase MdoB-like AlkP superfamily enzyme